jgi:hypothetical protein
MARAGRPAVYVPGSLAGTTVRGFDEATGIGTIKIAPFLISPF